MKKDITLSLLVSPLCLAAITFSLFISGCSKSEKNAVHINKLETGLPAPSAIPTPLSSMIDLKSASNYTILSQSGITTTGATSIQGNIGVGPITAAAMTGFAFTANANGSMSSPLIINGFAYGPATTNVSAIKDMQAAYTYASQLTPASSSVAAGGDISGQTFLKPGIFKYGTTLLAGGTITLTGNPTDVYIFQIGTGLTVAAGTKIVLVGGLSATNVFWVVGSAATFGTSADFSGTILAKTLVSLNTGDVYTGKIFAQTAVTMIADKVLQPVVPKNLMDTLFFEN